MKTVFITGATGAIGSALVPYFLAEPDTQLTLLLRAESEAHLAFRMQELLDFWGVNGDDSRRIRAFRGDVCKPRFALNDEVYRSLSAEVTHFIHSAGNVKLNQTLAQARVSSLDSAREVVRFSKEATAAGQFSKLEFVSTVGVAGRKTGLVLEQTQSSIRQYHNTYEAAKAEAEAYLFDEAIGQGVSATVHRPSMVVGDSNSGKIIHFQVFYHLCDFLTGRKTWGLVPDPGKVQLDIVPVDFVAQCLYQSSCRLETCGRIFHLCSGPRLAPKVMDLAHRVRSIYLASGLSLPKLRVISPRWFNVAAALLKHIVSSRTRRAIEGLPFFLTYLDEPQTFDNSKTVEYFSQFEIRLPAVEDYLDKLISYRFSTKSSKATRAKPDLVGTSST